MRAGRPFQPWQFCCVRSLLGGTGVVLLLACLGSGCGYHSTSTYLNHIDTIRIPPVENRTLLIEMEDELTSRLQDRFRLKWSSGDDATLLVAIHDYWIEPRQYDVNNLPEQYRMSVSVDYEMHDNVKRKLSANAADEEYHLDFYVVSGRGEEPMDEESARHELLDDLVDALYYSLAEQW